jgi:hypothetical protein
MSSVAFARSVFSEQGLRFPLSTLSEDDAFFCLVSAISDLGLVHKETVAVLARSQSVSGCVEVDPRSIDCMRVQELAHYRAAALVAVDPHVSPMRRREARLYRDDLVVRHWITVIANAHQDCAREMLPSLRTNWSIQASLFRAAALLPPKLARLAAPIAQMLLRAAGIPSWSPFSVRRINYPT